VLALKMALQPQRGSMKPSGAGGRSYGVHRLKVELGVAE
jgi:hypothetical protein